MRNLMVMSLRSPMSLTLLALVITILSGPVVCQAADPGGYLPGGGQHRVFHGDMPPGAIVQARLMGRGPIAGYYQPVAFSGPEGARFALPQNESFVAADAALQAGLLVGAIYRFRITGIPRAPGAELYPTVEVIDRTYPPPGMAHRYPIPINLDQEDLEAALEGRLVTRVVLLEDPQTAIAVATEPTSSRAIDIAEYQDALEVADRFGRPVAIVRIGSVTPPRSPELMPRFYFGFPAWVPVTGPQPQTHVEPSVQP